MRTREQEVEPLINLSEITEVELLILKRMREFTIGEHSSLFHGTGFDFVGLRDWQAGDRFEDDRLGAVVAHQLQPADRPRVRAADHVRRDHRRRPLGVDALRRRPAGRDDRGVQIATLIARAIATIGMSAVFFQDSIGLITFDEGFRELGAVRPRIGKGQVIHCLEAYQHGHGLQDMQEHRQPQRDAQRVLAQDLDDAGDLGFPVRRSAGVPAASCRRSTTCTTCSS